MSAPVVSYMLPCYRGHYAGKTIAEVVKKASCKYEFLVWLNLNDGALESQIEELARSGCNIKIAGKTPENIGMAAFKPMIEMASGSHFIQLEDDVLFVSCGADSVAVETIARHPKVAMLSSEVWQDELTNGGHPAPDTYRCADPVDQLFAGPIDGGFTVCPRSSERFLMESSFSRYFGMGAFVHSRINGAGLLAYKCRRMRIFHIIGASYHSAFPGALEFELQKYAAVGKTNLVEIYKNQAKTLPPTDYLLKKIKAIGAFHDSF